MQLGAELPETTLDKLAAQAGWEAAAELG